MFVLSLPVSLENLTIDIRQMTSGIQLCKREFAQQHDNTVLREFLLNNEDKVKKLDSDMKKAEVKSPFMVGGGVVLAVSFSSTFVWETY